VARWTRGLLPDGAPSRASWQGRPAAGGRGGGRGGSSDTAHAHTRTYCMPAATPTSPDLTCRALAGHWPARLDTANRPIANRDRAVERAKLPSFPFLLWPVFEGAKHSLFITVNNYHTHMIMFGCCIIVAWFCQGRWFVRRDWQELAGLIFSLANELADVITRACVPVSPYSLRRSCTPRQALSRRVGRPPAHMLARLALALSTGGRRLA
jgi:hypothetical protein